MRVCLLGDMNPHFNPAKDLVEMHATVWGKVQGVGFRVTARQYALQLGIKGTVSNLDDGNVEIIAQGPREKLEEFLTLIKKHFGNGYIARVDTKFGKTTRTFEQFLII